MRADILQTKKCVHVKLEKETHAGLRAALFRRGLSMQEIFEEFARLIVNEDGKALRMLDKFAAKKVKLKLQGIYRKHDKQLGEFDADTLYSLIEAADGPDTDVDEANDDEAA
jgi:hypothetical protein